MRSAPSPIILTHPACQKCGADMEVAMIAPTLYSQGRGAVTYVCLACGIVAKTFPAEAAAPAPRDAA